jgi:diguanylate cyclase
MRYSENREQTAELMRMVLPLMSRHAAGFHPLSYAVWYEYAAGTNQALKAAIDSRVAAGVRLKDNDIEELFDRHVAMRDIESSKRVRARIQEVVEQVTETTNQASEEVGRYSSDLDDYQQRLQNDIDREAIAEVVQGLRGDTNRVRARTSDFQQNLEANSREARRLQQELEVAQGRVLFDPLTSLLNRRGLEARLREHYAAGVPAGGLLCASVDEFGAIADKYGNLLSDRVLATVAQIMGTTLGTGVVLARTGAEAFVALLPGTQAAALLDCAESLRSGVERCRIRRQDSDTVTAAVTMSIGAVTVTANPVESLAAVLARAEPAMLRARADGGNRITIGSP